MGGWPLLPGVFSFSTGTLHTKGKGHVRNGAWTTSSQALNSLEIEYEYNMEVRSKRYKKIDFLGEGQVKNIWEFSTLRRLHNVRVILFPDSLRQCTKPKIRKLIPSLQWRRFDRYVYLSCPCNISGRDNRTQLLHLIINIKGHKLRKVSNLYKGHLIETWYIEEFGSALLYNPSPPMSVKWHL